MARKVPDFDFSVPEVTSISADVHKYGYSVKGASVLLYHDHPKPIGIISDYDIFVYTETKAIESTNFFPTLGGTVAFTSLLPC